MKGMAMVIGGIIAAFVGVPSAAYLLSPGLQEVEDDDWIDLRPLDQYSVGAPTRFEFSRTRVSGWERASVAYGAFVVRLGSTQVRVFSDVCTHLGCRVGWHKDVQHYISPCHDGHFDRLGGNISGPPPRPLDEFASMLENGRLWIQIPPFRRSA